MLSRSAPCLSQPQASPRVVKATVVFILVLAARIAHAAPDGLAPPEGFVDRSGVTELVFWQGVNGLLAGSVLGYAVTAGQLDEHCRTTYGPDQHHSQACKDAVGRGAGIAVVGLATGIGLPLLLTRGREVKTADALLVNRSTLIGAMHGYIIPFAAGLEPFNTRRPDYVVSVDDSRWLAGLTFAGDIAGVGVGTFLANRYDPTPGKVSFLGTLHSATFIAALSVGSSFPDKVDQHDWRLISAFSLGLADIALGIGLLYSDHIDIGRNRVFWLDTGAMVGWLAGGGLGSIVAGDRERALSIGGALGMTAGIILSYWATSGSEAWRQARQSRATKVVELDAPGLRVMPAARGTGRALDVSLDLLRGRF
jgi:hypothetical protein